MGERIKLVKQFDRDGDGHLNAAERKAAREFVVQRKPQNGRRPRMRFPRNESAEPAKPGPKVSPDQVRPYPSSPFYDSQTVRTLFLQFETADWEKELTDFHHTDVDVPATLNVDGRIYPEVGVHFRGASSFDMVGEGSKHSLSISMDFLHEKQQIGGYRSLNLLNSHEDPSFLRSVLFYQIAREYIPAPKANFVRVVINGESWGVYVNAQQFNKDFLQEWFHTTKGNRWKVPGSPNGRGSLAYIGDDPSAYKSIYQIKSKDTPQAWTNLIHLCKVLNETPPEKLEQALAPLLDVDGALKFLALENALINDDGYWIRTSDYNLYQDVDGKFHVIPHDANETFSKPGGPGFGRPGGPPRNQRRDGLREPDFQARGGGPGNRPTITGVELDPLYAAKDAEKPLISRLLAVPSLRARYLGYVREIARTWLDWNKLGPIARQYHSLISDLVKADTRKLDSFQAFEDSLVDQAQVQEAPGPGMAISLKRFATERRAYLLK